MGIFIYILFLFFHPVVLLVFLVADAPQKESMLQKGEGNVTEMLILIELIIYPDSTRCV